MNPSDEEGKPIDFAHGNRGILTDYRPSAAIRLTPVPPYTSYLEVRECVQYVRAVIDGRGYEKYSYDQVLY